MNRVGLGTRDGGKGFPVLHLDFQAKVTLVVRLSGGGMKSIVNQAGEIIAITTEDYTLIGGHHRLAVAASIGQQLFWKDTGEPVKLSSRDPLPITPMREAHRARET